MEIKLAESIRTFRKERSLTQEQLAEVLGVTVGAVYKWEAGLSTPELPLIVEMADFFDTSIDVLLGYILKDNRIDATARRLRHCQRVKDLNGLEEAEKALKKYPNSFIIVYRSAMLYQALGLYKRDNAKLRRALELLEKARPLLHQNTNPRISEQTLYVAMAEISQDLEDDERALELIVTDYLSVGDYVLTGGELPAMVMIDCISRLVPGVLNNDVSAEIESFHDNLLEYPQYTRPEVYEGMRVPEVLLSGHHKNIETWRRQQSIKRTLERRPDLLEDANLSKKERQYLAELMAEKEETPSC